MSDKIHVFQNIKNRGVAGDNPRVNIIVQLWGKHVGHLQKIQTTDDLNRNAEARGLGRTWKKKTHKQPVVRLGEFRWGSGTGFVEHSDVVWNPRVLGILEHLCTTSEPPWQDHNPQSSRSHVASLLVRTAP